MKKSENEWKHHQFRIKIILLAYIIDYSSIQCHTIYGGNDNC